MARIVAVLDACVLYPAPLRDLLMSLAWSGVYQAKWTNQIHGEWIDNLLENEPHRERAKLERTRDTMNQALRDCLVEGYEALIPTLELPDVDDRHVVAAALRGGAEIIVTFNLKDFPARVLSPLGILAQHPDDFVLELLEERQALAIRAIREQRARLKDPPRSVAELLETFEAQRLSQTAARLRRFADVL